MALKGLFDVGLRGTFLCVGLRVCWPCGTKAPHSPMSLCAHCTDNAALAKVSLGGILNVKGGGGGGAQELVRAGGGLSAEPPDCQCVAKLDSGARLPRIWLHL